MADSYFIGLMSGTSVDGIDAALISINHNKIRCLATQSVEFSPSLRSAILDACSQNLATADEAAQLDHQLAEDYAKVVHSLLAGSTLSPENIIAIGSHGQTINHAPDARPPFSLQIGNAQHLANLTGIAVVSDFRSADMAVGGQGAPLAPAFHNDIFRSEEENRVVANLGGIANISVLAQDKDANVIGFDTGPANALMDYWINVHLGKRYDKSGRWAASGSVDQDVLSTMLADPYFQRPPPKSTGREHFNSHWLATMLKPFSKPGPADIQATLCELTVVSLSNDIKRYASDDSRLILCGGGTHNVTLVRQLQQHLPSLTIESSSQFGIDPDYVEAIAFAWLAHRQLNKLSGNLPSVTGATKEVVLGRLVRPALGQL